MDELSSVLGEVMRALGAEVGAHARTPRDTADFGREPGGYHRARPLEGAARN